MKKIIMFILSVWILGSTALFAQDVILKRDDSMIAALVDEITETEIVYRNFNNPDGPKYRISKDTVARILFQNGSTEIFARTTGSQVSAQDGTSPYTPQYAAGAGRMNVSRGDLELNGRKLSEDEIFQLLGDETMDEYERFTRQRRMGKAFIGVGAPLFVVGDIVTGVGVYYLSSYNYTIYYDGHGGSDYSDDRNERLAIGIPCLVGGLAVSAAGAAFLGVGIPSLIKGNRGLSRIANDYNAGNGYASTLTFGPSLSGVGFTYRF